jgi:hypothetical protein
MDTEVLERLAAVTPVAWRISDEPVDYPEAVKFM